MQVSTTSHGTHGPEFQLGTQGNGVQVSSLNSKMGDKASHGNGQQTSRVSVFERLTSDSGKGHEQYQFGKVEKESRVSILVELTMKAEVARKANSNCRNEVIDDEGFTRVQRKQWKPKPMKKTSMNEVGPGNSQREDNYEANASHGKQKEVVICGEKGKKTDAHSVRVKETKKSASRGGPPFATQNENHFAPLSSDENSDDEHPEEDDLENLMHLGDRPPTDVGNKDGSTSSEGKDGRDTNAWEDHWLPIGNLSTGLSFRCIHANDFNITSTAREVIDRLNGIWPQAWLDHIPRLQNCSFAQIVDVMRDLSLWKGVNGNLIPFSVRDAWQSLDGPY
ncbi:hypothetical protein L6452_44759 [Arctium lappa]|nr:hypothetical protein L6452_44759 [Arctium lappa]